MEATEGATVVRHKRGRKIDETLPKSHQREIQRNFRARRSQHLIDLEHRVEVLERENLILRQLAGVKLANREPLGRGPTGCDFSRPLIAPEDDKDIDLELFDPPASSQPVQEIASGSYSHPHPPPVNSLPSSAAEAPTLRKSFAIPVSDRHVPNWETTRPRSSTTSSSTSYPSSSASAAGFGLDMILSQPRGVPPIQAHQVTAHRPSLSASNSAYIESYDPLPYPTSSSSASTKHRSSITIPNTPLPFPSSEASVVAAASRAASGSWYDRSATSGPAETGYAVTYPTGPRAAAVPGSTMHQHGSSSYPASYHA